MSRVAHEPGTLPSSRGGSRFPVQALPWGLMKEMDPDVCGPQPHDPCPNPFPSPSQERATFPTDSMAFSVADKCIIVTVYVSDRV